MRLSYWTLAFICCACGTSEQAGTTDTEVKKVMPRYTTSVLPYDSDDPAIWLNQEDLSASLIIGTDKEDTHGGIYAFDLRGQLDSSRMVTGVNRPNNVDIAYGFPMGEDTVDIMVFTERGENRIRVYSMPGFMALDGNDGIPVFEDDTHRKPMGVALYTRLHDQAIFAVVSRKENPDNRNDYLYQYRLFWDGTRVKGELVRKFGEVAEGGEIEAICVDDKLGYIYYSDESFGIRKYHANPDSVNTQLAVFGKEGFVRDREGISLYETSDAEGFLMVSDQQGNEFHFYRREGEDGNPHEHPLLAQVPVNTNMSDGSEATSVPLGPDFPEGMFVAMSDDRTFQYYDWRTFLPDTLR